jgi:hypothetical protein
MLQYFICVLLDKLIVVQEIAYYGKNYMERITKLLFGPIYRHIIPIPDLKTYLKSILILFSSPSFLS